LRLTDRRSASKGGIALIVACVRPEDEVKGWG
jgi:hypothetical protein